MAVVQGTAVSALYRSGEQLGCVVETHAVSPGPWHIKQEAVLYGYHLASYSALCLQLQTVVQVCLKLDVLAS